MKDIFHGLCILEGSDNKKKKQIADFYGRN